MVTRILRHAAWPALLSALTLAGCNSPPVPADAFVTSYIQGTSASPGLCKSFASQTQWIDIGVPTGNSPTTVADQGSQAGGQVTVACRVSPNGSGFDVQLNAALSGPEGGSVTITSNSPITTTGGMGVTGTFESAAKGNFSSQNCAITLAYNNGKVPVPQAVAAGRIWAHLSCTNAQSNDVMEVLPDGGTAPETCDTEADFLFENCAD
jgi:hypothetical protein